jgi:hypothetical protein
MQFPFSIRIKNATRRGKQQQLSAQEEKGNRTSARGSGNKRVAGVMEGKTDRGCYYDLNVGLDTTFRPCVLGLDTTFRPCILGLEMTFTDLVFYSQSDAWNISVFLARLMPRHSLPTSAKNERNGVE